MKRVVIAFAVWVMWMTPVLAGAASPDALLSDADRGHQEQAIQNALEFNRTGEAESWENAATGHRGLVTPTLTYRNFGGPGLPQVRTPAHHRRQAGRGLGARAAARWPAFGGSRSPPRPVYTRGHDYPPPPLPVFSSLSVLPAGVPPPVLRDRTSPACTAITGLHRHHRSRTAITGPHRHDSAAPP